MESRRGIFKKLASLAAASQAPVPDPASVTVLADAHKQIAIFRLQQHARELKDANDQYIIFRSFLPTDHPDLVLYQPDGIQRHAGIEDIYKTLERARSALDSGMRAFTSKFGALTRADVIGDIEIADRIRFPLDGLVDNAAKLLPNTITPEAHQLNIELAEFFDKLAAEVHTLKDRFVANGMPEFEAYGQVSELLERFDLGAMDQNFNLEQMQRRLEKLREESPGLVEHHFAEIAEREANFRKKYENSINEALEEATTEHPYAFERTQDGKIFCNLSFDPVTAQDKAKILSELLELGPLKIRAVKRETNTVTGSTDTPLPPFPEKEVWGTVLTAHECEKLAFTLDKKPIICEKLNLFGEFRPPPASKVGHRSYQLRMLEKTTPYLIDMPRVG